MLHPHHHALMFFFIILLFSSLNYSSQSLKTTHGDDERGILLSLKQHYWGNPSSLEQWNSTSSPCDWPGISCNFNGSDVTGIYLYDSGLKGSFPSKIICQLNSLSSIDFSHNSLWGSIPVGLSSCSKLEDLDLSANNFTGNIPGELFSMKTLRSLYLQENKLSGEIPTISMVAHSLENLDLSSNQLNGSIPDNIGSLYNLVQLDLSKNSLSGPIPARLLQLHKLYYISLASNNLSGEIPVKLDLFSLKRIDLSDNQFSGDICETVSHIWDTPTLDTLRICLNHFSGRIPYELVKGKFQYDICFDKVNLCSDLIDKKELPTCPSQWLSDTLSLHINCSSNKPSKSKKIIITCVVIAALLIIGLGILIRVFRPRVGRRKEPDGEEWSMISFQRLKFNKWDILGGLIDENLIGNGGSGKVYRVITKKGQKVAVKSIRHEPKQGQGLMEKQFLAEVKILGGIWHNNIVKLLCCIRGNTTKLLVYEYMDKQCLHKWLHGKKRGLTTQVLQWERRLKIAIGAAQGLCYLHHNCSLPIVHRDIKSSNILVDSDFNAKIADFGLAKIMASEGDPETASAVVGTFGYIAPEYGSTRKVDAKCDIYSFGVLLLELTTGREAVTGNEDINLAQWAHKHQREGKSVADALDEEIKDPRHLEAMITIFKLGLACTLSSPSSRPSMKDISRIL
ncbi:LRR receptor-like serine/threonine-protein kinase GSO2 [Ipomoea triloba]|uniref:LRR receptor-like serine/threonine-protein kinase GSO2 n=1 Tax=Ipomoea triloba TaxID=35885 RepID=UPI00125DB981|nr:LRR receptor-like serine/threonine-protein kinase GSO2 [Ipomoea triloba]